MGRIIDRRRAYGGKKLPYDAEIEYLQSSGTQWIDTGIAAKTPIRAIYEWIINNDGTVVGSTNNNVNLSFTYQYARATHYIYGSSDNKVPVTTTYQSAKYKIDINLKRGEQIATIGNVTKTSNFDFDVDTGGTFRILYRVRGKIFYLQLYSNDTLVFDAIPVRKGDTGYMYDKISGQLFGNSGTGDFILGADKVTGGGKHLVITLMPYFGERRAA